MRLFARSVLLSTFLGGLCQAVPPDFQAKYRFTNRTGEPTDGVIVYSGATATLPINNSNLGCIGFSIAYDSEGFSGISLNLQTSPMFQGGGASGTWSTYGGTSTTGTLPLTSTSQGTYVGYGYYPFIRVNLATATGTGSLNVQFSCWKSLNYASLLGGGGTGCTVSGTLTNILIIGAGNTCADSGASIDASQNAVFNGTVTAGNGGSNAGGYVFPQGTTNSVPANAALIEAPTSIPTAYKLRLFGTPSSGPVVCTFGTAICTLSTTTFPSDATKYYDGTGAFSTPAGGFTPLSKGETGNIVNTGSDVTIYTFTSVAPLSAGSCYFISFYGALPGTATLKVFFGSSTEVADPLTGVNAATWNLTISVCNDAGVQNAQHVSMFVCQFNTTPTNVNSSQSNFQGMANTAALTSFDTSSAFNIVIKSNAPSGNSTGHLASINLGL